MCFFYFFLIIELSRWFSMLMKMSGGSVSSIVDVLIMFYGIFWLSDVNVDVIIGSVVLCDDVRVSVIISLFYISMKLNMMLLSSVFVYIGSVMC